LSSRRDENALYYNDWVESNIAKVDKATGGKVGYIHIRTWASTA